MVARICLNCSEELAGKFCHVCGQRDSDLRVSFWRLVGDALKETFEIDGRIPRTLRYFFTHPGFLVREYLAGRRIRYSSPVRLYIFTALVCFLTLGLVWEAEFEFSADDEGNATIGVTTVTDAPSEASAAENALEPKGSDNWFEQRVRGNISRLAGLSREERARRLTSAIFDATPTVLTVMLPIFALILKLFYWRRRYIEHLIYALNIHALALALVAIAAPFGGGWPVFLAFLGIQVHVVISLRRVYEQSWLKTIMKYVFLAFVYLFLAGITASATLAVALLRV